MTCCREQWSQKQKEIKMYEHLRTTVLAVMTAGLLFGCASAPYSPKPFEPAQVDTTGLVSNVDTFVVILDNSDSMNSKYQGRRKYYDAKDTVANLNQTIPSQEDYQAGMVAFGSGSCMDYENARLVYGLTSYQRAGLAGGLDLLECAGGGSPLANAVDVSDQNLNANLGNVAVIIVSDFEKLYTQQVIDAVVKLRTDYGDRLCIHAIQVGDDAKGRQLTEAIADQTDDGTRGRELMEKNAGLAGCGSVVSADDIASPNAMADYVAGVFYGPVLDSDGDGVTNDIDQCPNTPKGARVNAVGCWVLTGENVLFDFNSAVIRDASLLNEAIEIVTLNPEITGEIQGYTDSAGPEEYNLILSEKRANAVRDYFVQKGVDPSRIRAKGYGESRPVASNDTEEGRQQNRRVELHPDQYELHPDR
jgi:OOP family OmpA-OmpF porin